MPSAKWAAENQEALRRYRRDWYHRNREAEIPKAIERAKVYTARNVELLRASKDKPCTDCGIQYPFYVMQFDHVRGKKLGHISVMAFRPVSLKKLQEEIAKCEVVCANCHSARTFARSQAGVA